MPTARIKYNFPAGYGFFESMLNSRKFLHDPIGIINENMVRFKDTYSANLGPSKKIILTRNPQFVNHVLKQHHRNYHKSPFATERATKLFGNGLLFSNGEYWLRQRRLIQPAFHKEKIRGLHDTMIRSIWNGLEDFPIGDMIDIYPLIHRLSFNVLLQSQFDIRIQADTITELQSVFTELQDFHMKDVNQPFRKLFYPFNGEKKNHLAKAMKIRELFRQFILERRSGKVAHHDILDMLIHSRYEDTGEAMNDEQIIDEMTILMLAGYETTANSLSWLLYLLSINPDKTQKLISTLKPSRDSLSRSDIILEALNNEYLKATINEGMRLYPAAWMTDRVALNDDQFEQFSYPKGTIIIPYFYGLHRHENLWEHADSFQPERFTGAMDKDVQKAFFPFGAGPRMCIGNNFAIAEMCFFIAAFFQRFTIEPTGFVPRPKPLSTLTPDKVLLHLRQNP